MLHAVWHILDTASVSATIMDTLSSSDPELSTITSRERTVRMCSMYPLNKKDVLDSLGKVELPPIA